MINKSKYISYLEKNKKQVKEEIKHLEETVLNLDKEIEWANKQN